MNLKREDKIKANKAKASFIFDCLNRDSNGFELQKLLIQWGLPENEVDEYLVTDDDDDEKYSFDEFCQNMKSIWDFASENMIVSNDDQVVQPSHPHSN
ncbi:unnamed protein product [Adineta steineri]|uniref:EF-hand domain-containing protein n=1 Tax=Adineta steineri TaxID=433720 RepID=A0A814J1P3_9BILA|nr:unnamed protein product [Adineta steineri]CAF1031999.1 unnamed protein product [Adineta steineri]